MVVWRFAWQLFYRCVFYLQTAVKKNTVNNDSGLGRRLEKIKTNHARRRRGFRKDTGCVGVVKRVFPGESGSHLTFTRRATPLRAVVWPTYQDRPNVFLRHLPLASHCRPIKKRASRYYLRVLIDITQPHPPASQPASRPHRKVHSDNFYSHKHYYFSFSTVIIYPDRTKLSAGRWDSRVGTQIKAKKVRVFVYAPINERTSEGIRCILIIIWYFSSVRMCVCARKYANGRTGARA